MSRHESQTAGGKPTFTWAPEVGSLTDLPEPILRSEVLYLRLVVHTMGINNSSITQRSENHWTIFLVLSTRLSVHLNFRQGATGEPDVLVVKLRNYVTSNSALRSWDYRTTGSQTVGGLLSHMYQKARHEFRLNGAGNGCRHWVWTVMGDFQDSGLVEPQSAAGETVRNIICFRYTKRQEPVPSEPETGTFTNVAMQQRGAQTMRHNPTPGGTQQQQQQPQQPQQQPQRQAQGPAKIQPFARPTKVESTVDNRQGQQGRTISLPGDRRVFIPNSKWVERQVAGREVLYCEELNVLVEP